MVLLNEERKRPRRENREFGVRKVGIKNYLAWVWALWWTVVSLGFMAEIGLEIISF